MGTAVSCTLCTLRMPAWTVLEPCLLFHPLAPLRCHALCALGFCAPAASAAAFMGAALSLLGDRRWQGLLRREDPQAFASAKR